MTGGNEYIRVSVGIEDVKDIIADIDQALDEGKDVVDTRKHPAYARMIAEVDRLQASVQDALDAVERHALGYDAGLIAFGLSCLVLAWLLAAAALYLASDEGGYVTGQTLNVNGGAADDIINVNADTPAAVTTDLTFLARLVENLSFEPAVSEGRRRYLAQLELAKAERDLAETMLKTL